MGTFRAWLQDIMSCFRVSRPSNFCAADEVRLAELNRADVNMTDAQLEEFKRLANLHESVRCRIHRRLDGQDNKN